MKEINYQVFDKVSGLPFESLTDKMVREFADTFKQSFSIIYNTIKEDLEKQGILYLVFLESKNIIVIPKCNIVQYKVNEIASFEDYQDALKFIEENK